MSATARVETVQEAIERKNRETAGVRRNQFSKKATDQKVHENLFKSVEIYIEAVRIDPASKNTSAAFREMSLAMTLSRRNLKP